MSDIVWQNLPQTNFNDSNQLMQVALQAWDNAYKTAQGTLADVNKAVNNRNEAQIQAFINSIPKDNWLGSQEAINDKITQVANQSGNMFDPKVLETYRDGRGTTLLQRDKDRLDYNQHKRAEEEAVFKQSANTYAREWLADKSAYTNPKELESHIVTKSQELLEAGADPEIVALATQIARATATDNAKQFGDTTDRYDTTVKKYASAYDGALGELVNQMVYGKTEEDKQKAHTQAQAFIDSIPNLAERNQAYNNYTKMVNDQFAKALEQAHKDREYSLKKYLGEGQLELGQQKVNESVRHNITTEDIAQQTADTSTLKVITNNSDGNTLQQNKATAKRLDELNLTGSYDPKTGDINLADLGNVISNNIQNTANQHLINENNQSYTQWQASPEGSKIMTKLSEGGSWLTDSKLTKLNKAFEQIKKDGKKLSESDKILLASLAVNKGLSWLEGDATKTLMNELGRLRQGKATTSQAQQKAYFNDVLTAVGNIKGLSQLEVYVALQQEGNLSDEVLNLRPDLKKQAKNYGKIDLSKLPGKQAPYVVPNNTVGQYIKRREKSNGGYIPEY